MDFLLLFGLGVTRIHRDPNFIAILQAKARWPLDENRVADWQRLGKLSVDGPVIARLLLPSARRGAVVYCG